MHSTHHMDRCCRSGVNLQGFSITNTTFINLTSLRNLALGGNAELCALPQDVFAGLSSLETLELCGAGALGHIGALPSSLVYLGVCDGTTIDNLTASLAACISLNDLVAANSTVLSSNTVPGKLSHSTSLGAMYDLASAVDGVFPQCTPPGEVQVAAAFLLDAVQRVVMCDLVYPRVWLLQSGNLCCVSVAFSKNWRRASSSKHMAAVHTTARAHKKHKLLCKDPCVSVSCASSTVTDTHDTH